MSGLTIVNFSHPLSPDQLAAIERKTSLQLDRLIDVPVDFDDESAFADQTRQLFKSEVLGDIDWERDRQRLLVILPMYGPAAAVILAHLHGVTGGFPTMARIGPVRGSEPLQYMFQETIDLQQAVRAQARKSRFPSKQPSGALSDGVGGDSRLATRPVPQDTKSSWKRILLRGIRKVPVQLRSVALWSTVVLAIAGTIIGDTVFELTTSHALAHWSDAERLWRALLFLSAIGLLGFQVPQLAQFLRSLVSRLEDVEGNDEVISAPAVLVFVSNNPTGGHTTVVERLLQNAREQVDLIVLIASDSDASKSNALDFKRRIDSQQLSVEVEIINDVSFSDVKSAYEGALKAIDRALVTVPPTGIVLDITGGNAIASCGGLFAAIHRNVQLSYVKPSPTSTDLSEGRIIKVDASWMAPPPATR